ncbi:molybdenum cofactor guanylyltransferase MobA [Stutzerimonas stutzeri]|uniref:molybdenum cofactor guanylyltransferase MobA n=1 Tax=Stutzerimonas stutzeri TaxID=316 RepID=UPI0015E28D47|nr:molybdenum cofactor guanylyltransferase MobA [Stutzerimonas stutzeri]MBA1265566.1 molybdenum cofactor guanylyltransferase MobA [Stutzerimonas stutzeri]
MPQHLLADCSILLLAGGRGQRMGGHDKGLVVWHGKPLVAWPQRIARPLTDDLLISCNRNPEYYAPFADRLISDDESDFPGPLAGIRAGLAAARHQWLLVLPCDAPLIDEALLLQLHNAAQEAPDTPVMLRRGEQWEPLFCIIPLRLAAAIEAAWQAGERSNRRILLKLGARSLDLPEDDPRLANLNSPELLAGQNPPMGT